MRSVLQVKKQIEKYVAYFLTLLVSIVEGGFGTKSTVWQVGLFWSIVDKWGNARRVLTMLMQYACHSWHDH